MKKLSPIVVVVIVAMAFTVWSATGPAEWGTWFFELVMGAAGIAVLVLTYRRFRFSKLAYLLACVHFAILAVGARYTYAEEPLFNWLRDELGLARNHFDRLGHFAQGFVPAMFFRELLLRVVKLRPGVILGVLCVGLCLAFSALYELIEWALVLVYYGQERGTEWLGMQGDMWDAHWDMLWALIGATLAIVTLSRLHDRSMERVTAR